MKSSLCRAKSDNINYHLSIPIYEFAVHIFHLDCAPNGICIVSTFWLSKRNLLETITVSSYMNHMQITQKYYHLCVCVLCVCVCVCRVVKASHKWPTTEQYCIYSVYTWTRYMRIFISCIAIKCNYFYFLVDGRTSKRGNLLRKHFVRNLHRYFELRAVCCHFAYFLRST